MLILSFFTLLWGYLYAQDGLPSFNADRLGINKNGMLVLGSWALVNMATSPVFASRSSGTEKAFHQMNGYWNTVNLVIASFGYYAAVSGDTGLTLMETLKEQQRMEKILLFNTALDLGYITGGFLLKERSRAAEKHKDRLKGFGNSLILQGGFLFVFDLTLYLIHQNHSEALFTLVDHLAFSPTGFSLTWKI